MRWLNRPAALLPVAFGVAGCAAQRMPVQPIEMPATPAIVLEAEQASTGVRAVVVPGSGNLPAPPQSVIVEPRRGSITLNFPSADVRVVAKAVLGDLLRVPYAVAQGASAPVSLVTPGPVARSALLGLFETALRQSNLALVPVASGYEIRPLAAAQGPVSTGAVGFGSEVITLRFVSGEEVKKLLDTVLPGVVIAVDPGRNIVTIAGTTGQRASARDLLAQFDVNWLRNVSFALLVPDRTDSRLIVPELEKLINAPDAPTRGLVRLIAMQRLNGILAISAQPQYLDDVRRWVEILDREGQSEEPRLFVYRVQNGRARDLAKTINAAFGNDNGPGAANADPFAPPEAAAGSTTAALTQPTAAPPSPDTRQSPAAGAQGAANPGGRITADEVNNAILVYSTPRQYAIVEDALRRLDLRPVQVMIEAAITEVTLNDNLRYGVQWNFATGDSNFALTEGATTAPTRITPGFSYFLTGTDISVALNALEQRTNIKVISAPKILVLNNQTAAMQVGDQVPVTTAAATNLSGGSDPAIVNSIEYRDTGVILKVTPRVNASGLVLLDISQEVSDVNTRAASSTTSTQQSPVISTRRISTSIAAQDGQVIAIGGLFRNAQTFGKNGIPILSRIPILGSLFGTHINDQVRTELIVLLKPHVIRTLDDGRAVTEELRAKLRTVEPFRTQGRIP